MQLRKPSTLHSSTRTAVPEVDCRGHFGSVDFLRGLMFRIWVLWFKVLDLLLSG